MEKPRLWEFRTCAPCLATRRLAGAGVRCGGPAAGAPRRGLCTPPAAAPASQPAQPARRAGARRPAPRPPRSVINGIQSSDIRNLFNPENIFISKEGGGAGNNWASGYEQGEAVQETLLDMIGGV